MHTCPASEDALRTLIADAFTRRDANALAGVMRWEGVGGSAARQRMRELSEMTERPLLGIDIDRGGEASCRRCAERRVDDADRAHRQPRRRRG